MRWHALQGDVDDNMRPVVRATQVRGTTDETLWGKWFTLEWRIYIHLYLLLVTNDLNHWTCFYHCLDAILFV